MKGKLRSESGGVLVVVLTIVLVAAAMTAGWIAVMTSQIEYVAQFSSGAQRRIALGNATALTRQYLLANVLTTSGAAGASADLGGGWGAVTIPASAGTPLATFNPSAGTNHFNPGNGGGYTQDLTVSTTIGTAPSFNRLFQVRSRSSVLSGTLAVVNAPAASVSGSLAVSGQTLLWNPAGTYSITTSSYAAPSQPAASLSGLPPGNFPFVPLTGSEIAGVPNYGGSLNVVANESGINSLAVMAATSAPNGVQSVSGSVISDANGVESDGLGTVTIDLLEPALGNVVISGDTTNLVLTGQATGADRTAAGNAAAIVIVVNQTNALAVSLTESNNRKAALAIKSAGAGATFTFPNAGVDTWRLVLTLESTPATFNLTGAQTLTGGIQSDSTIAVASGAITVAPETDPKLLDRLTARDGWVEAYTP